MVSGQASIDRPKRHSPRLPNLDYADPSLAFFVTIRADKGLAPFTRPELARAVIDALLYQHDASRIRLYAYVLMPDHLHAALSLASSNKALTDIIRDFKGFTTTRARQLGLVKGLWQRSFYDHVVRREEGLKAVCEYILANPVRKGLVETWS